MIQAFVSLRLQQPSRTDAGMRSFFEALQNAVFSQPTIFRSNADATAQPYSLDAVVSAALNPGCKFVVLRAEREKFWQCTFLLPDKQGMGALFFDLQRQQNPRRLSPESLIEMFKKLYTSLSPRLIRIGDSEAREKLKSRHGLVLMPGLGRIEWLQIVSPEVYGEIYNPSDLVAAPGYATDIWEDGALFMRVYDDPNDWDSEDNISQANFIPGFLAGIAKIEDGEKERKTVQDLEKLWSRAEKTADKAYEALNVDANNVFVGNTSTAQESASNLQQDHAEFDKLAADASLSSEDRAMRDVVAARLRAEFSTIDENNIVKVGTEGPCTMFKVKVEGKPLLYATYQDMDHKVFILNDVEDLSRFISANDSKIAQSDVEKISRFVDSYYHPEYKLLKSLDDLPADVIRDRRMPELRKEFKPAVVEDIEGNQNLVFWLFKPEQKDIEKLEMVQFENWPIKIDAKIQCTDMENEEEPAAPAAAEPAPAAAEPAPAAAEPAPAAAEPAPAATRSQADIMTGESPIDAPVAARHGAARKKTTSASEDAAAIDMALHSNQMKHQSSSKMKVIIVVAVGVLVILGVLAFLIFK